MNYGPNHRLLRHRKRTERLVAQLGNSSSRCYIEVWQKTEVTIKNWHTKLSFKGKSTTLTGQYVDGIATTDYSKYITDTSDKSQTELRIEKTILYDTNST